MSTAWSVRKRTVLAAKKVLSFMMSEENLFKKLVQIKTYPNSAPLKGCQVCISGLVHVQHSETKHSYVFRCKCPLGNGRQEKYKIWDNSMNFEPLWRET